GTRLCVPNDATLREALLTEAHSSPFTVHSGSTKMYHDLKQHFWWSGMKRDPLDIPVWKWDEISMDFVTGLPQSQRRHDAIWVVVDRLTKSAHFLPIRKDYSVSKLAETFQQEIVRLHGTLSVNVSDRDPCFASRFWKSLQKAWGTRLKFSTAFHPQTDGQTERTIQTLEDMLRFCALEWTGNWDDYICLVEFAYNNSWHASIKCAPFEMLYGRKCRALICWDQVGERVIEGQEMIKVTNKKVTVAKEKLKEARTRQKSYADKHRRSLEFQPGDRVFLKVSPARGVRRFGIKGKLSPRFIGPFEILDRVGEVSDRLALPPHLSHVHNVFHVSLLKGYKYHPLHVISYPLDQIRADLSYDEISMDFVTGLPQTQKRHDAIWVVVDRLTKSTHFLPIRKDYSVSKLAEIFQQEIVRLHGTPSAIVLDRDPRFASLFRKEIRTIISAWLSLPTTTVGMLASSVPLLRCCMKLKEARTHQKSYADKHRRSLEFQPGDHVFLKVSPARGVRHFGIKGKLSPRFIEHFEILDRVGEVSYRLALPPQLSHVHKVFHVSLLRGYKYHPFHVISYPLNQICADLSYVEEPEAILDHQERDMRKKTILFVKILWRNHPEREAL
nr:putative nucleotidyltransferase, ribonuclease H [Tanacetum cinerariifolium]